MEVPEEIDDDGILDDSDLEMDTDLMFIPA